MNTWPLIYFSAFLFYTFSGIYVLSLSKKSIVNRLFFLICLTLSLWSLGFTFSLGAKNATEALAWRGMSTFGWTFFYSTMLIFMSMITHSQLATIKKKYFLLLYIPSVIFFFRFLNYDTGNYIETQFGWIYILYTKTTWSYAFDLYYLICVITSFLLLVKWHGTSESIRERKQAKIIASTLFAAFICGGLTDTLLPIFGMKMLPLGVMFCTIAIMGMWRGIVTYKMMQLTQEIAAEKVLITMMDPVIVMNMHYIIGQVNNAAIDLAGYAAQELIGEHVSRIIESFDINLVAIELGAKGFTNGNELILVSKSGKESPCLCSGVCVNTDYGERVGYILVLHDISRRKQSEKLLENVNEQLKIKMSKINNIFDNVKEGVLTFHQDLLIDNEYSLECSNILGDKIENHLFSRLLYPDNPEKEMFTATLLKRIFEVNQDQRGLYLPLLPSEVMIHQKNISIHYQFTTDATAEPMMMAILTDQTEKIQLENLMEKERRTLKMVVNAILNKEDFIELIAEYQDFAQMNFVARSADQELLLRKIHTLKGNCSQFDLFQLVDHLDQLEAKLYGNKKLTLSDLNISQMELLSWLNEDLKIIEAVVGKEYFQNVGKLTIEESQLIALEERIHNVLPPNDSQLILQMIQRLRNKSFHELLNHYPGYTVKLGERWGKLIHPFEITGDRVYVDPNQYQEVVKNLSHIFRNAVAHGIEMEEGRIESAKDAYGKITCQIIDHNHSIQIIISDDGKGIDVNAIERQSLANGLLTKEALMDLQDEQKLQLIFRHKLSTNDSSNTLSGRGVGLAAVKYAVDQCGGTISVTSAYNLGTTFIITLPS